MFYREISPAPALRAHVRCYWFLRDAKPAAEPEPVLPDGSVEWIFHLGAPFLAMRGGAFSPQSESLCIHDLEGALTLIPGGIADVAGVRFRPGRAYPFLDVPARELMGATWDLGRIPAPRGIRERLGALATDEARARLLDEVLVQRLNRSRRIDGRFDALVAAMDDADGAIPVGRLAGWRGVSPRQLERTFLERVGTGPKRFSRLLRFRRVVREIRAHPRAWLDGAMAAGFYDQSHLIREFRTFAGMTPGELARSLLPLNDLFVEPPGSMSHSYNLPVGTAD